MSAHRRQELVSAAANGESIDGTSTRRGEKVKEKPRKKCVSVAHIFPAVMFTFLPLAVLSCCTPIVPKRLLDVPAIQSYSQLTGITAPSGPGAELPVCGPTSFCLSQIVFALLPKKNPVVRILSVLQTLTAIPSASPFFSFSLLNLFYLKLLRSLRLKKKLA